jgi:Ca-activated chloride channel family protein
MSFLAPTAFFLSLLLPVIIIMYLLKLRRTELIVSSVFLWRRMVRDIEANSPWQKLRRNLLLFLQLIFLITLIITLARPFTWIEGLGGNAAILILDTSASMAATDVSPSRLEAAKEQTRQVVESLPDSARVTILTAGQKARVMVASSLDRREIFRAIDNISQGIGTSDLATALQLASAIAARQPETQIIVLSDGGVTLPERMNVKGILKYLPIGTRSENQAISLLTLEAAPGGGSLTAFVQVTNYGDSQAARRLAIYADGQLFNVYDLEIPPGQERAVLVEGISSSTSLVEAQLDKGENIKDDLALDDRVFSVYRQAQQTRVSLVSQGNLFLEKALSLFPGLKVTFVRPGELTTFPESDLTIFDSYTPLTETLPIGNLLFIGPLQSTNYFTVTGKIDSPAPVPAEVSHPLLENISLDGVHILDATRINLPEWARQVILGKNGSDYAPLLFNGEVEGRRVAVLTFNLHHSDLPLQIAFPILLANMIYWLAPGSGNELPTQVTPGSAVTFLVPLVGTQNQDLSKAVAIRPDGSSLLLEVVDNRIVFADTNQLGIYEIRWGDTTDQHTNPSMIEQFAVNLFTPQESDTKPVQQLSITGVEMARGTATSQRVHREWWRSVALIALALLMVEWLVYQRAALAFLSNKILAIRK